MNPQPAAPKKGWFGRNWPWLVPVGCLLPVLLCGGGFALIFGLVFGMLKESAPYEDALAAAQASPALQQSLGTPIEPSFMVTGSINLNNNNGDADIAFAVSGPNAAATVYVSGTKTAGVWTYTTFEALDASGNRVPLQLPSTSGNIVAPQTQQAPPLSYP